MGRAKKKNELEDAELSGPLPNNIGKYKYALKVTQKIPRASNKTQKSPWTKI